MSDTVRIPYIETLAPANDWGEPMFKGHPDDAAYDLRAAEDAYLSPGDRALIPTGIAVAIPVGYAGFVMARSGLALRHGLTIPNGVGLIDPGYRGDVGVILQNNAIPTRFFEDRADFDSWYEAHAYQVKTGDRIAQLLIIKTADVELSHAAWLPHSERADAGFGSTGR